MTPGKGTHRSLRAGLYSSHSACIVTQRSYSSVLGTCIHIHDLHIIGHCFSGNIPTDFIPRHTCCQNARPSGHCALDHRVLSPPRARTLSPSPPSLPPHRKSHFTNAVHTHGTLLWQPECNPHVVTYNWFSSQLAVATRPRAFSVATFTVSVWSRSLQIVQSPKEIVLAVKAFFSDEARRKWLGLPRGWRRENPTDFCTICT